MTMRRAAGSALADFENLRVPEEPSDREFGCFLLEWLPAEHLRRGVVAGEPGGMGAGLYVSKLERDGRIGRRW